MHILTFSGHAFAQQQSENYFRFETISNLQNLIYKLKISILSFMFIAVSQKNEFTSNCAVDSPLR